MTRSMGIKLRCDSVVITMMTNSSSKVLFLYEVVKTAAVYYRHKSVQSLDDGLLAT
eukprot:CAMPEP_0116042884 /NCGR_PEP_ID=MMETSP0321-20121206/25992_1 /TAXON_ID=163516 /ORGANISM="Leptocylindrus danicus var. danicus, Strain B650" /LENGTH=55 /DNA_ID=CAMNT_0003523519 /DNA_START=232 /DNA_END=399 /DNA_ORIENTATION=+